MENPPGRSPAAVCAIGSGVARKQIMAHGKPLETVGRKA